MGTPSATIPRFVIINDHGPAPVAFTHITKSSFILLCSLLRLPDIRIRVRLANRLKATGYARIWTVIWFANGQDRRGMPTSSPGAAKSGAPDLAPSVGVARFPRRFSQRGTGLFPATLRTWNQTMWWCRDHFSQSSRQAAPIHAPCPMPHAPCPLAFSCASSESRGQ